MGTEESYTKQKFFYWCVARCRLLRAPACSRLPCHGCGAIATASCTHCCCRCCGGAAARVPATHAGCLPLRQPASPALARRPTSQPARNWSCARRAATAASPPTDPPLAPARLSLRSQPGRRLLAQLPLVTDALKADCAKVAAGTLFSGDAAKEQDVTDPAPEGERSRARSPSLTASRTVAEIDEECAMLPKEKLMKKPGGNVVDSPTYPGSTTPSR